MTVERQEKLRLLYESLCLREDCSVFHNPLRGFFGCIHKSIMMQL